MNNPDPWPSHPCKVDMRSMLKCMKKVFVQERSQDQFAAIRYENIVIFDAKKLENCARATIKIMTDSEKLDELLFLCSTTEGRKRKRLTGGGRKSNIPPEMDLKIYQRMCYITLLNGKFTREELIQAFKDYAEGITVVDWGANVDDEPGRITIYLSHVFLHRWRSRWGVRVVKGKGVTHYEASEAMEKGFPSLVRCHTALRIMELDPELHVGNTDQTWCLVQPPSAERGYAVSGVGNPAGNEKEQGGRNGFTLCATIIGHKFSTVYIVLETSSGEPTEQLRDELARHNLKIGMNR